jgi:hypothetical protein
VAGAGVVGDGEAVAVPAVPEPAAVAVPVLDEAADATGSVAVPVACWVAPPLAAVPLLAAVVSLEADELPDPDGVGAVVDVDAVAGSVAGTGSVAVVGTVSSSGARTPPVASLSTSAVLTLAEATVAATLWAALARTWPSGAGAAP